MSKAPPSPEFPRQTPGLTTFAIFRSNSTVPPLVGDQTPAPAPPFFPRFNQRAKGRLSPLVAFFFLLLFFSTSPGWERCHDCKQAHRKPG